MIAAAEKAAEASRSSTFMLGVSLVILALLLVVILMFLVLIILRFVMSRRELDFEEKKESLRPLVFKLITGDEPPDEIVATLRSAVPDRHRDALESVLLENARALKGHESDLLAYAYENLGFMREDLEQLERGKVVKRCESAFHVGTMRVPGAVPALVGILSSDSTELRFTALNALSKIGTEDALDAVMKHLAADPDIRTLRIGRSERGHKRQPLRPHMRRGRRFAHRGRRSSQGSKTLHRGARADRCGWWYRPHTERMQG